VPTQVTVASTPLYNINIDVGALLASPLTLRVNETGTTDTLSVRLATKPRSAVSVRIGGCDAPLAVCSPSALVFTASNYAQPQTITVRGVRNTQRGDLVANTTLSCSSSDGVYAALPAVGVQVTNVDIYWPSQLALGRDLYALGGMNATLTGGMSSLLVFFDLTNSLTCVYLY